MAFFDDPEAGRAGVGYMERYQRRARRCEHLVHRDLRQGSDTLFWPTGNPGPDYNGDERGGEKVNSDCILALDPATGRLKWYYQFTPHDLWDWDATETPMVIDASWQGRRRMLLVTGES